MMWPANVRGEVGPSNSCRGKVGSQGWEVERRKGEGPLPQNFEHSQLKFLAAPLCVCVYVRGFCFTILKRPMKRSEMLREIRKLLIKPAEYCIRSNKCLRYALSAKRPALYAPQPSHEWRTELLLFDSLLTIYILFCGFYPIIRWC